MIANVQNDLNSILGNLAILQNANGAGRIFELFVMTGVARALRARGYDVWLQRSDGSRILPTDTDRRFIQRGGAPTGVPSASGPNSRSNASSIGFQWPGRQIWEMHNGVQFTGRSAASHEVDIAILPGSVATALRSLPTGGSPLGRPRVSIECKDVGTNGSVDEMRAFVARMYDLTLLGAHHPHLGVTGAPRAIHPGNPAGSAHNPAFTYWDENRRTLNVIARRTGFVHGAAAMTSYHAVEPHEGIVVGSSNATTLMDAVADWVLARGY